MTDEIKQNESYSFQEREQKKKEHDVFLSEPINHSARLLPRAEVARLVLPVIAFLHFSSLRLRSDVSVIFYCARGCTHGRKPRFRGDSARRVSADIDSPVLLTKSGIMVSRTLCSYNASS